MPVTLSSSSPDDAVITDSPMHPNYTKAFQDLLKRVAVTSHPPEEVQEAPHKLLDILHRLDQSSGAPY